MTCVRSVMMATIRSGNEKKIFAVIGAVLLIIVIISICKGKSNDDYAPVIYDDNSTISNYEETEPLTENEIEETIKPKGSATTSFSPFSNLKVGDNIKFGKYEQDNDVSNGAEDIEWNVLIVDFGTALVVSKYCLDCQPFDEDCFNEWEGSSLRKWMNDTFYNTAFSDEEQNCIKLSDINNYGNDLYDVYDQRNTSDKIFALSMNEAQQCFADDSQRLAVPTKYAKKQGVEITQNGNCTWWLRTTGSHNSMKNFSTCVSDEGWISDFGESAGYKKVGVRPAMWIVTE